MTVNQLSPAIPILCGLLLLRPATCKDPAARILKPTLLMLSVAGIVFGVLEFLLAQQRFRTYVGWEIANYLGHFKYIIGGVGIGAVLCSLFYGHWKSAWLAKKTISPSPSCRLKAALGQGDLVEGPSGGSGDQPSPSDQPEG